MKLTHYLEDKAFALLLNGIGLFLLCLFLHLSGSRSTDILIIAALWLLVLLIWLLIDFSRRKKYFARLFTQLAELDQPYLISEVMESSPHLADRLYREILRSSNRSVIEKIHRLEDAQRDYKEYIEQWIHQVKLPLTAATLICENHFGEESRRLQMELRKIDQLVEQVLFYARTEHPYQDYLIHPVNLREVVLSAIAENKPYFIQKIYADLLRTAGRCRLYRFHRRKMGDFPAQSNLFQLYQVQPGARSLRPHFCSKRSSKPDSYYRRQRPGHSERRPDTHL